MQGTSTVIDAMQSWKHESNFIDFMDEQATFPRAPPSPLPLDVHQSREPRREDLSTLQHVYRALQSVESFVTGKEEETRRLKELMSFIRSLRSFLPVSTVAQQFELLHPLRAWLFWLPISFLQRVKRDTSMLVVLAHFYAVALAMGPVFPEIGASYFGSMSVSPIEEIMRCLTRMQDTQQPSEDDQVALNLMQFPLDMVVEFRARMGWAQHSPLPYPQLHLAPQSPYSYSSVELHTESDLSEYPLDLNLAYHSREHSHVPSSPSVAGSGPLMRPRPSPLLDTHTSHHLERYPPRSHPTFPLISPVPGYTEEDHHLSVYSPSVSSFPPTPYSPQALWT